MSVIDDVNSEGAYRKLLFVEFLELLGRVAHVLYEEPYPLHLKLEQVLRQLLTKNQLPMRIASGVTEEELVSDTD